MNCASKRYFGVVESGDARLIHYRPPAVTDQQSARKMVGLFGHESKIRRYTHYTNEPIMALGAWGDSSGYRWPLCWNDCSFVNNTCGLWRPTCLGNFGVAAGFCKLSTKEQYKQFQKPSSVHQSAKILYYSSIQWITMKTEWEFVKKRKYISCSIFCDDEYSSQKMVFFQNIGVRHIFVMNWTNNTNLLPQYQNIIINC